MAQATKEKVQTAKAKSLQISPSLLNLYLECPRCFWLKINKKVERPSGPSSTLPNGMDYTLKNYYDSCRSKGLPSELKDRLPGKLLEDGELIKKMRQRSFGFQVDEEVWFGGALDDVVVLKDGTMVPLDNKAKGFPPKDIHWTQIEQMSGYTLMLRENGFATVNEAYLVLWYLDHKTMDMSDPLAFHLKIEKVSTDPDGIRKKILDAAKCLRGSIPQPGHRSGQDANEPCLFCQYRESGVSAKV